MSPRYTGYSTGSGPFVLSSQDAAKDMVQPGAPASSFAREVAKESPRNGCVVRRGKRRRGKRGGGSVSEAFERTGTGSWGHLLSLELFVMPIQGSGSTQVPSHHLRYFGMVETELLSHVPLQGASRPQVATRSMDTSSRKHGEGFFRWVHLSCSHESHCKVSLQGIIIMKVIARTLALATCT